MVFFAAVALLSGDCVGVVVGVCYFHVVFVDYCFHVVHATVADFDVVFVEEAVVFMLVRKVLRYELQECSTDVCLYVFTKWRVVPYNVSLSVASGACWLVVFIVS